MAKGKKNRLFEILNNDYFCLYHAVKNMHKLYTYSIVFIYNCQFDYILKLSYRSE